MSLGNHLTHVPFLARCVLFAVLASPLAALGGTSRGPDGMRALRDGPGVMNHPVNVVPTSAVSIPRDWPLGLGGTITCTTCHAALPRLDRQGDAQLRGNARRSLDSKVFCTNCHREDGPRTAAGMHWLAVPRAHVMQDGGETISRRGTVGDESRSCLSCHDGVTAADAGYETTLTANRGFLGDKARNHPIGMPYPRGGTRGVEVRLRPASLLPETVSLPNGRVGCQSCHNLYGTDPQRLSVPIEGSKLCLTCHEMD